MASGLIVHKMSVHESTGMTAGDYREILLKMMFVMLSISAVAGTTKIFMSEIS